MIPDFVQKHARFPQRGKLAQNCAWSRLAGML